MTQNIFKLFFMKANRPGCKNKREFEFYSSKKFM